MEAASAPEPSLIERLTLDHERLDDLLTQVRRHVGRDLPAARNAFETFYVAFRRHERIEEELLVPLCPRSDALSQVRQQHVRLEHWVDELRIALDRGDLDAFRTADAQLRRIVPEHRQLEDEYLYPQAQAALGPEGTLRLLAAMRYA